MAGLANLNGVSDTIPAIPKLPSIQKTQNKTGIRGFHGQKSTRELEDQPLQITTTTTTTTRRRRIAIGLASIALIGNACTGNSLAEDNGLWLTGPLPVPSVSNQIANKETGTRSFLKKGLYMANIGKKGRELRLRKYAFDLLGLGDLLGKDAWNYFRKYLRIKSTFMYYDFDKAISAAPVSDKQPLTDLANRLFDSFEKLEDAAKQKNLPQTESCYQDTTDILQEVMTRFRSDSRSWTVQKSTYVSRV